MNKIELLSPAKNLQCGIEAVNHGADAVYVGASNFGARAAAGNSLQDIEKLVNYAHLFAAKVYVTLNTLLTDDELSEAETLIRKLYSLGTDALIIQDMGLLQLDLPPMALHASTQTDNRSVEKVRFMQSVGFDRVILARELSLEQIETIHHHCSIELEAFVHGALCVSYSGLCNMSQACSGRSANRGNCAQYCRLPYTLRDADGKELIADKHLLSLKDMDRSMYIEKMMKAGITSFKIEGRLKEVTYVKNITAYYRQKIDAVLETGHAGTRSSFGKSVFFFTPNPQKTFYRGGTDYFLQGRTADIFRFDTPKSMGEPIGTIVKVQDNFLVINQKTALHNGDGLCFIGADGSFDGFRVNRVEEERVFPADYKKWAVGTELFRNYDHLFEKILKSKSAERKLLLDITLQSVEGGFNLIMADETGRSTAYFAACDKMKAEKPEKAAVTIKEQLSKMGDTIFTVNSIQLMMEQHFFIPASMLSAWRRAAVEQLLVQSPKPDKRKLTVPEENAIIHNPALAVPSHNRQSVEFYKKHGLEQPPLSYESNPQPHFPLMICKHCIKYAMGWCSKQNRENTLPFKEPLFLQLNRQLFELKFDCANCECLIYKVEDKII